MSKEMFYLQVRPSIPELRAAIDSLKIYDGKKRLALEDAIDDSVKDMAKVAKQKVPVDSGKLKKSIFSKMNRKIFTGYFGAKAHHAHLIEFGAKASTEKAKDKKALVFYPGYAVQIFSRSADIPAREAHPFITPAYDEVYPKLIRRIKKAMQP